MKSYAEHFKVRAFIYIRINLNLSLNNQLQEENNYNNLLQL